MKIEQLYTKCLAEATYYITSDGEAAIIDPLRETQPYLEMLKADKGSLKYIFLTHFHADFVSGHVDLGKITGAQIVFGPTAKADFEFYQGHDDENFRLGQVTLRLLHTPGHTLESSSYLLFDEKGKEYCLFSGDTIFIGDVGRPDLAVTSTISKENLAAKLYESIQEKVLKLPDDIIIYPNHGKGSACGKNMSNKRYDTLRHQKKVNYALDPSLSQEEFVKQVLEGLTSPPQYFSKNAKMNTQINKNVNQIINDGTTPISISNYIQYALQNSVLLLDVRSAEMFAEKHIPNSLFIGLEGNFAPWVGLLIENINQAIVIVAPNGKEQETVTRLSRIGFDNVIGYIKDGVEAWEDKGFEIESVSNIALKPNESINASSIIDVRRKDEYEDNHVKEAINFPLNSIFSTYNTLNKASEYYVYCAGGYRSIIAISILKRLGFNKLINLKGGFLQILKSKTPLN